MPDLLAALDAFLQEHRRCGDLGAGIEPSLVWMTCDATAGLNEKKLGADYRQVAQDLLDGLPSSDKTAWIAVPVEGWASESLRVTRRASVGYCVHSGSKCIYKQGQETFTEGEEEKAVKVDAAYLEAQVPAVRGRLKRAGIRLAHLLNSLLGQ